MKDHFQVLAHRRRNRFSAWVFICVLLTAMFMTSCEVPGISNNGNNNGVGNNSNNTDKSCNGTNNCNHYTINVVSSAATPPPNTLNVEQTPIWHVSADGYANAVALTNGYRVNDPVHHHFIIVYFTFTNNTSQVQALQSGHDIYLRDSYNRRYNEDQASNPSNVLRFNPNESQGVYTAYVVPDSICDYTLVVANSSGQDLTWNITITRSSGYCTA